MSWTNESLCWRSGRDSNPREVSLKLISSQPRYDRFDTAACCRPPCRTAHLLCHIFSRLARYFFAPDAYSARMKRVYLSVRLKNYEDALALAGAIPAGTAGEADALLLTGGGDLHPRLYGRRLCGAEDIDAARDARELALTEDFLRRGLPVFGICRGLQVINVFFGGTLRQHIEGHSQRSGQDRLHPVCAERSLLRALYGARFTVNSAHHQSVDRLGEGLRALARADDGTIEALAHASLPVFGVQWHPERLCGPFFRPEAADGALLLSALLRRCKKVK